MYVSFDTFTMNNYFLASTGSHGSGPDNFRKCSPSSVTGADQSVSLLSGLRKPTSCFPGGRWRSTGLAQWRTHIFQARSLPG